MKTNNLSLQEQRKRKFLLVVPAIVFCFTTLLFWALGGGQGEQVKAADKKGLSMKLPAGIIAANQTGDKMAFYDQARADSLKKEQLRKGDPYSQKSPDSLNHLPGDYTGSTYSIGQPGANSDGRISASQSGANPANVFSPHQPTFGTARYGSNQNNNFRTNPNDYSSTNSTAENEARINQRLIQLQAVINRPQTQAANPLVRKTNSALLDSTLQQTADAEDPELRQMNGLLEKILEIQHPERAKAAADKAAGTTPVKKFRAIPAVIDGTQKIVQGTVICLKLTDTVTLGGQLYQKGQRIYGSGTLSNQRYTLNIKSIHVGYNFYPVDLTVFDQTDGLEGISVPEAITGDALRDGATNGVQNMDIMSFDPSMTAQLTTAGINTAKGLFGKKIKQVKGKLKDGHTLLLRDNQEVKNSR